MNYRFTLATQPTTPFLQKLKDLLESAGEISDEGAYNSLLRIIISHAKTFPFEKTHGPLFAKELIEGTKSYPLSEPTIWGGVPIKEVNVEKDYIRKLLVVKQYGILGFEIHKEKVEKLEVLEGICLLFSSEHSKSEYKEGVVEVILGEKGEKVTLQPGDEHGIIALTDCVIQEESTNHLTDLVYIFPSSQVD